MDTIITVIKILLILPPNTTCEFTLSENILIHHCEDPSLEINRTIYYELNKDSVCVHTIDHQYNDCHFQTLSISDHDGSYIPEGGISYSSAGESSTYLGLDVSHFTASSSYRGLRSTITLQTTQLRSHSILANFPTFPATPLLKFLPFHSEIPADPDAPPFILKQWQEDRLGYRELMRVDSIISTEISLHQLISWKEKIKDRPCGALYKKQD